MKNKILAWYKACKREVHSHPKTYCLLTVLLAAALFVRVYRTDQILRFYYDQGRDALVIWRFWHEGKFFLVGPTTGIEGIFRGPWYYWLIAPFYLLGGGDPVWPANFLAVLSVLAIFVLYVLAVQIEGRLSGIIAVIIASFSFYFMLDSRWLSNPTPMFLISMLLLFFMFQVMEGKRWSWLPISFLLGLAMQFGSAAEIFYFPAIAVLAIWQRKNLPNRKILFWSLLAFFITLIPQVLFDIRHNGVLLSAIKKFLFQEESFRVSFWEVVKVRLDSYYQLFFSKLQPVSSRPWIFMAILGLLACLLSLKSLLRNQKFIVAFLVFIFPLIGMLFFQGNYGNVYGYYFTASYLVFVLLFSVLLSLLVKRDVGGVIVVALFFGLFFQGNFTVLKNFITGGADGPLHISLGNEMQAVDWILGDARGTEFNIDSYVPPVIPYAYDYLFLWQTNIRCGESLCGMVLDRETPLLYTLYEVDPPHPERLEAWLARQKGIGVVEDEVQFGGITVQRRTRIGSR